MNSNSFINTLLLIDSGRDIRFSHLPDSDKRKVVVAALLDLYKSEALGSGSNSVAGNLSLLSKHVELLLSELNKQ
ncbi:hypothetical protein [Shewanella algae]|uniref:hypothetical protein n=1 Tax=Shewanella algae TaxID=38313 RepID=UPI001AAD5353|nr:hypothetical protein [Shewanella algae]MBO2556782.1 hypothetical protein [Shewanella algae]MBO2556793.1 hypothetical protein [Shewanella algae]MBO2573716.1 hypothetical protein [Shewanella algae]MBO2573727.1 hypothetical protein [Shewanella algae]